MFSDTQELTIEGITLLASTQAIFVPFLIFKVLQDKFCNTTGILLDPGFKTWICCMKAISLQHDSLEDHQSLHLYVCSGLEF